MIEIKLSAGDWRFSEEYPLGPEGGFGEVFIGEGGGNQVAIKRLKLSASEAAHRELNMGRFLAANEFRNVVPILDCGKDQDSDRYYLVMPICEMSLQDHLDNLGRIEWEDASSIVLQIADGLLEVSGIVHRDLKPGNVLFSDGVWKVADFGIAKFVEDSTSLRTLRGALTPPYAAPEQWKLQSPTNATDVYALGCIVHTMINGEPPFGYGRDGLKEAHLSQVPPRLESAPTRIETLVSHMLRKIPDVRPSLERCKAILQANITSKDAFDVGRIEQAGVVVARRDAAKEGHEIANAHDGEDNSARAVEAILDLNEVILTVLAKIEAASESTNREENRIELGNAVLSFDDPREVTTDLSSDKLLHNIIAESRVSLLCRENGYRISSTLIFGKTRRDTQFRWREIWFFSYSKDPNEVPFSLATSSSDFVRAITKTDTRNIVVFGPSPIDLEDSDDFVDRWTMFFSKAAEGTFKGPKRVPIETEFFSA